MEGLHAAVQADQQSQLEDLARKYEAEGKTEIAATLRRRVIRLTSTDPAAEAVEVIQRLTEEPSRMSHTANAPPQSDLRGLPDFSNSPSVTGKKRRKAIDSSNESGETGAAS